MTQKDTVNVIEGSGKYSAQVLDRWMTRVINVPGGSRGARLTHCIRRFCAGGCDSLPETGQVDFARGAAHFFELSSPENIEARVFARTSYHELGTQGYKYDRFLENIQVSVADYSCWAG
jgi:hypothetical protein